MCFKSRNSPVLHWLGLHAFTAEDTGSVPGWGTWIPHAEHARGKNVCLYNLYCVMSDLNISFSDQLEQVSSSLNLKDHIPY